MGSVDVKLESGLVTTLLCRDRTVPNPVTPRAFRHWDGRGHFFAAAAEAMRRILVESARRKHRFRHGGDLVRVELDELNIDAPEPREDLLALDTALDKLKLVDGPASELVQLRYFAGLTQAEAAEILDISPRTADRLWAYARAWLHREVQQTDPPD